MYYVYILTTKNNKVLYIGVTNDLTRRTQEHKSRKYGGFTKIYGVNKLVYYEKYSDITIAIAREKQLKGCTRAKKIKLIESKNPLWDDWSKK